MIVGFREFEGQFRWIESKVGAVMVGPDGVRYECVKRSDYGVQWKIIGGQGDDGRVSITRMRELVGDGAGWMIAEVIPDTVYIVVDADDGGLGVGGGQGAARALSRVIARTRLCASPDSLYGVLRRCEGAGGMWARSRCESA